MTTLQVKVIYTNLVIKMRKCESLAYQRRQGQQ